VNNKKAGQPLLFGMCAASANLQLALFIKGFAIPSNTEEAARKGGFF
jgi:hypothetical protein